MTSVLSVEELLSEGGYEKEAPLRVYLGAAPGVGKTYRMLQDGCALKEKGIDVVVGYVEDHGRTETMAQLRDLEVMPRQNITYRGVTLEEMDTQAIIQRKPALVLVDELAHTNVPGSAHNKRYEDIEDILAAGIAVFSTCNIQHLESVHDMVERMTGVEVKERVPDTFFSVAREMIIVDVTPDELQDRMRQGKIYPPERIDKSLKNFFTRGNISVLRELALRELANDVEQKDKEERREVSKAGVQSSEKVLVAVAPRASARQVLRVGSRMSGRMNARWIAAYVENPKRKLSEDEQTMLRETLQLARTLGATVVQLRGEDVAQSLLDFAREEGITQIVIGATQRAWWKRMLSPSVVTALLKQVGEIAVHVYPIKEETAEGRSAALNTPQQTPREQMPKVTDYLCPENILANLREVETVEQTIALLTDHLILRYPDLAPHRSEIQGMIMRRERLMSTFLETGIAIPHAAGIEAITDLHAVMALTPNGVISLERDRKAYIVLLFLSPEVGRANHLKFLAAIARVFLDETTTREVAASVTAEQAYEILRRIETTGRLA